jgi:zinc transport system substrate-binding protein
MQRLLVIILLMLAMVSGRSDPAGAEKRLCIGITLHPYYSFVKNIVGDKADVEPLIGAGFNPHSYEPQPNDIKRVMEMDAIVINGIGHDGKNAGPLPRETSQKRKKEKQYDGNKGESDPGSDDLL